MDAVPADEPPSLADALAHERFVRAVAARVLGGDPEVDDVVQETWIRALLAPPRQRGALRAWLATVARNLAIGKRRESSRRERHEGVAAEAARGTTSPSVAEVVAQEDARRRLVDAILALEEPYRTTLLARYREDRRPKEVAALLGVPVETVHTRVRRGLALLRSRLDRDHGGDRRAWAVALAPWAAGAVPAGIAATVAAGVGGLLMGNAMTIGAAAVVLVGAGLLAWPRDERPAAPSPAAAAGAPTAPSEQATANGPALSARPAASKPSAAAESAASEATGPMPKAGTVVDGSGSPVASAKVRLYLRSYFMDDEEREQGAPRRLRRPDPLATGESGADGRFVLAYADGDSARMGRTMLGAIGADLDVVAPDYAHVVVSLSKVSADDLRVTLTRGGLVTLTIVRADGQPVLDALVLARRPPKDARSLVGDWLDTARPELELVADAGGRAEGRLEAGRWHLRVRARGLRPVEAPALDVGEGEKHALRVVIDEGVIALAHVVDADGKPVAGARVIVGGPMKSVSSGVTDADGRCRVAGIAPAASESSRMDEYWSRQLFHRVLRDGVPVAEGFVGIPPEPTTIPLEITLPRPTPVRVRVVDEDGAPIAAARASLEFASGGMANPIEPHSIEVAAEADGVLLLPPLGPGPRRLSAGGGEDVTGKTVELAIGREPFQLDVVLERRASHLEGRVVSADGGVPAGLSGRAGKRGCSFVEAGASMRFQKDGSFAVDGAPRGALDVFVAADGVAPQRHPVESGSSPVEIRLRDRGAAAGLVVARDGTPRPGVRLQFDRVAVLAGDVRQQYAAATATTDAEGRFRVVLDEEPADLMLDNREWIVAPHGRRTVKPGDEALRIVAKPASEGWGFAVVSQIVTADGEPIEGQPMLMYLQTSGARALASATQIAGIGWRFNVFGRDEGPLEGAELLVPGYLTFQVPTIALKDEAPTGPPLEWRLDAGATVHLRIRDGDAKPVASRWLEIANRRMKTDSRGEVDVAGFPPGKRVGTSVRSIEDPTYTRADAVADSAPATIDVVLRRRGTLAGRLPLDWTGVHGDFVVVARRADGSVAGEWRRAAAERIGWKGGVTWSVSVFEDGEFTLEARTDDGSWTGKAAGAVGRNTDVEMR